MHCQTLEFARKAGCQVQLRPDGLIGVTWLEGELSESDESRIRTGFAENRDVVAAALRLEQ